MGFFVMEFPNGGICKVFLEKGSAQLLTYLLHLVQHLMHDLSRERKTATPRATLRKPCSFSSLGQAENSIYFSHPFCDPKESDHILSEKVH